MLEDLGKKSLADRGTEGYHVFTVDKCLLKHKNKKHYVFLSRNNMLIILLYLMPSVKSEKLYLLLVFTYECEENN